MNVLPHSVSNVLVILLEINSSARGKLYVKLQLTHEKEKNDASLTEVRDSR